MEVDEELPEDATEESAAYGTAVADLDDSGPEVEAATDAVLVLRPEGWKTVLAVVAALSAFVTGRASTTGSMVWSFWSFMITPLDHSRVPRSRNASVLCL